MKKFLGALLVLFLFHISVHAADKIRIGVPELNAQFLPLALAEKRSFFKEDGLQGEIIRINPTVALAALVSGELDYWTVIGNSVGATSRERRLECWPVMCRARPARSLHVPNSNPFKS